MPTDRQLRRMYEVVDADARLSRRISSLGFGNGGDAYRRAAIKLRIMEIAKVMREGRRVRNRIVHNVGYVPSDHDVDMALRQYRDADAKIDNVLAPNEKTAQVWGYFAPAHGAGESRGFMDTGKTLVGRGLGWLKRKGDAFDNWVYGTRLYRWGQEHQRNQEQEWNREREKRLEEERRWAKDQIGKYLKEISDIDVRAKSRGPEPKPRAWWDIKGSMERDRYMNEIMGDEMRRRELEKLMENRHAYIRRHPPAVDEQAFAANRIKTPNMKGTAL